MPAHWFQTANLFKWTMFGSHLALLHNVAMNAQFSLFLQWQQQSCTWPSLSLMGYQPPRCLEPSGSCCCWAPSTVRSSPPGPRNRPPAAGGRDAGNNREKKRNTMYEKEWVKEKERNSFRESSAENKGEMIRRGRKGKKGGRDPTKDRRREAGIQYTQKVWLNGKI